MRDAAVDATWCVRSGSLRVRQGTADSKARFLLVRALAAEFLLRSASDLCERMPVNASMRLLKELAKIGSRVPTHFPLRVAPVPRRAMRLCRWEAHNHCTRTQQVKTDSQRRRAPTDPR